MIQQGDPSCPGRSESYGPVGALVRSQTADGDLGRASHTHFCSLTTSLRGTLRIVRNRVTFFHGFDMKKQNYSVTV